MGIAEVIPGISGGSIAYVTGIYDQLIDALGAFVPRSMAQLRSGHYWNQIKTSAAFLAPLGLGMAAGFGIGLVTVLQVYDAHPHLLWGLIFGLLVGVVFKLARDTSLAFVFSFGLLGLFLGFVVSWLPSLGDTPNVWWFALGGLLAFSAWILPGISGSMMLLLLALWFPMLKAIEQFELVKILVFSVGLCIGLILMPRLVGFLLQRYRRHLIAFFCGLVTSAVLRAWPWKSLDQNLLWPSQYEGEPQVLLVVTLMVIGFLAVCSVFMYERIRRAT